MAQTNLQKSLYEKDFVAWLDRTAAKLKQRRFEEIDLENLIEEIEGLARRDRRELKNRLKVLLSHLLKRLYVNSPNDYRGWEITIREQRQQLSDLLEQSPSLSLYFTEVFSNCRQTALSDLREDYPETQFPNEWQYSLEIESLLTEKFWN
ncbi:MAG: DUF29 domain-containing protein [Leptolyngbya sp. Prado105]|jgi:hypothetical protein|nr:DUF29 domain-containing protein [Leptolyngbya sp. Prado105]